MVGIFCMFVILFRNIKLSLIGVIPNFIAAFFILGIIGIFKIPLDMMTITIAAITIGIAVDNSIHYIYRFREEYLKIFKHSKNLPLNRWNSNIKHFNYNYFWFLNFSNVKFHSDHLFWSIYWYGYACGNVISANTFTKFDTYF